MHKQTTCRFLRYNNLIAFHFDDTDTLYVSKTMAMDLAYQLVKYACDISHTEFTESILNEYTVEDISHLPPCQ